MTAMDLSTAVFYAGTGGSYAGGRIVPGASWADFAFPGIPAIDPATTYTVTIDVEVRAGWGGVDFAVQSLRPDYDFDASNWWPFTDLLESGLTGGDLLTLTLTIGPGVGSWADAVADGEDRLVWSVRGADVLAASFAAVETPPQPFASTGVALRSSTVARLVPAFAPLPGESPIGVTATSLPAVVLVDGRPV